MDAGLSKAVLALDTLFESFARIFDFIVEFFKSLF